MAKRVWAAALALGLLLSLPAGCRGESVEEESRIFAMDTVMTLTYHGQDRESCREALEEGKKGRGYVIDCAIDADEMVHPMVGGGHHITDFMLY